jgi:hypothetical protein
MLDPDVQWLFDQMKAASHMGALHTIQTIIKLEIATKEAYTKDEALIQHLRDCWKENEARLSNEKIDREKLSGEYESNV